MTFRTALVALIFASSLASPSQASDTLNSPFALNLTTASTQALLSGVQGFQSPSGTIQQTLPDQQLTTPVSGSLSGIHLTLNYAFNTPEPVGSVNAWQITSKDISAQIVIDSINASQTITESSDGVVLTLTLNATCSNVVVTLPSGDAQISAEVQLALSNGKPSFALSNFAANWLPGSWQVTSLNCQGPDGLTQIVEQAVQAQMQTISPFLAEVQSQIEAQLNSAQSTQLGWTLAANDDSGVSLTLSPAQLVLAPGGEAQLVGTASFNFSKLQGTSCANTVQDAVPPIPPAGTDTLVLPVSALQGLIQCAYLNKSLGYSWTSENFPAFQSILGNWFEKLFVWPDLLRFNDNSVFGFDLAPSAMPVITSVASNSSGDLDFNLSAPVYVDVSAPEKGALTNYVDFTTTASGPATLSIQNGAVQFQQTVSNLKLTSSWNPAYVSEYSPDTFIWTSQIAGDLKGFLSAGINYTLPTWNVPGAFSLSIGNMVSDGTNASISLEIAPQ